MTIIFFSAKYSFGYAKEDRCWYYLEDGNNEKLIREVHQGQIKYRRYGKNKRVSHRQLIESAVASNFKVEEIFCPF